MKYCPHLIHFCWFGGKPLTEKAEKSIRSWKKYADCYRICRWDENNFDVNGSAWTRSAYDAGKYAFVSDYARFAILYKYGGVYMDVGSELVKEVDSLITSKTPFSAIERISLTATSGLIVAVEPYNAVIASVLHAYDELNFSDDIDFLASHTVNAMFTAELQRLGFMREDRYQEFEGWTILPSHCFDPVYGFGGYHIKKDTYAVHKSSASWMEPKYRLKKVIQDRLAPYLGLRLSQIVGRIVGELRYEGLYAGLNNLLVVIRGCINGKSNR